MVTQETMNGATRHDRASDCHRQPGARDLGHDLVTLAELQLRLLAIDARQGIWSGMRPLVAILAGLVLALACVPIGLAAAALALADAAGIPWSAGLAIVFGVGAVAAAILLAAGAQRFSAVASMFDRSRYEWQRNMQWLKQTLRSQNVSNDN